MTEKIKARPFTEPDWRGFAGAEGWSATDPPAVREVGDWIVVADKNGVGAYQWPEDSGPLSYVMFVEFPNQWVALCFLDGLPDDFDPRQSPGFEEG